MDDEAIIERYWRRDEAAIPETKRKYHAYCSTIAYNILSSFEDTEECVADAYLKAWDSIPPARPDHLKSFLGRITHNLAVDRYRATSRRKCCGLTEVLQELEITSLDDPEAEIQRMALKEAVSRFLRGLDPQTRRVFVLRYWYYEPVKTISRETGIRETTVNSMLYRTRKKLKTYLKKEGWNP